MVVTEYTQFKTFSFDVMFEDAQDMWDLYNISPELTCTCDEFHTCQQCHEESTHLG